MAKTVKAVIGKQRVRGGGAYPSQPGYVEGVQRQVRQIEAALQATFDLFEGALSEEIMMDALQPTFETSQLYCPVDTGELKASGYLEPNGTKGKPRVEIGYGFGGHPDYTVYVHEMTWIAHAPPTQAKFLQKAVLEDLDGVFQRLQRGYQRAFNG